MAALSHGSFEAATDEVCAFLGPNGAGKTTSISILMGFLFADSGDVRVLGEQPGDVRAKAQIGFLSENLAFYKYLAVPELLRFHLALAGTRNAGADGLIAELLLKVKLHGYEQLKIGKYSRGMMQRLVLAQALLASPQLLVLDEPTSGLDAAGRNEVLELLGALKAEGKTIFLSSHILPEVEQICDRVVIIDRGRLVRAIALHTFGSLLRNRLIILFLAGFVCVLLLMMSPLLMAKSMAGTISVTQSQGMALSMLSGITSLVSGFGSLLAAWAAADVVSTEMRSGTILAVMARPVRRWEFLLGKCLGVQLLMLIYVHSTPWVLIVYPLVRYAVYAAIAMLLVTVLHPVVLFGIVLVIRVDLGP